MIKAMGFKEHAEEAHSIKTEGGIDMNVLEDRTVNIVLLTKRFGMDDVKKAIAQYMSEECECPIEVYESCKRGCPRRFQVC